IAVDVAGRARPPGHRSVAISQPVSTALRPGCVRGVALLHAHGNHRVRLPPAPPGVCAALPRLGVSGAAGDFRAIRSGGAGVELRHAVEGLAAGYGPHPARSAGAVVHPMAIRRAARHGGPRLTTFRIVPRARFISNAWPAPMSWRTLLHLLLPLLSKVQRT